MLVDAAAEVVSNVHLSPDYNVIALAAPEIARLARPGQFVMVKTGAGIEPLLRRPFSLFEITRDGRGEPTGFTLLSKRLGIATTQLYEARPGERLACLGPLGRPFAAVAPPTEAWMVAGGVGLAPFATLARALVEAGTRVTLFYGARRGAELFCLDVFERMGIGIETATEDGSHGTRGFVTVPLQQALSLRHPDAPVQIYACGPTPMLHRVAEAAATHRRPCAVSLEQTMGCGMGGCYSCVVSVRDPDDGRAHFVRSCLSGPVFDGHAIAWSRLVH
jgi:dihydroorotate dehydrogenase electron transfer subunit